MSRYSTTKPFTTNATFVVLRGLTIGGVHYAPGDTIPENSGLTDRVKSALYEQRRIGYAPEGEGEASEPAPAPKKAPAKKKKAAAPKEPAAPEKEPVADIEPTGAPTPNDDPDTPRHSVKQAGLGGFKVLDPAGVPVGPGFKTHAEAMAEAERLDGKK